MNAPEATDSTPIEDILAALEPDPDRLVVRNEFAAVGVTPQRSACGIRLRIEDLRTGQHVELDALELESLAWTHHHDLSPLLDPSASRWTDSEEEKP